MTVDEADTFTTVAGVETYDLIGASIATVGTGHEAVNITTSNAAAFEVIIGAKTVTGTFALEDTADIIDATHGANIAATGTTAEILDFDGTITITAAHYQIFDAGATGIVNATNVEATETVILTTAGGATAIVLDADVEAMTLANGTNTVTVAANDAVITGGAGADKITATSTHTFNNSFKMGSDTSTDRMEITNASAHDPSEANVVTVTNFIEAIDAMKVTPNSVVVSGTSGFTSIVAVSNTSIAALATAHVLKFTGSNIADLTADGDGLGVETVILAGLGASVAGVQNHLAVIDSGSNAEIYAFTMDDGGTYGIGTALELLVEHLATLTDVGADTLDASNFYV